MDNSNKIILDLCGGTGAWSRPYRVKEYDTRIITLPAYNIIKWKEYKWLRDIIYDGNVYGILAAPPCTMFSLARTNAKNPRDLKGAMEIVKACLEIIWECQYETKKDTSKKTNLKFWALENPNGMLKYFLGKPAFEFNPYDFGDDYKKRTHLWGWFNEPKKNPIKCFKSKFDKMKSKDIHPEQFGKLTRHERRSITPAGFAKAFYEANK